MAPYETERELIKKDGKSVKHIRVRRTDNKNTPADTTTRDTTARSMVKRDCDTTMHTNNTKDTNATRQTARQKSSSREWQHSSDSSSPRLKNSRRDRSPTAPNNNP